MKQFLHSILIFCFLQLSFNVLGQNNSYVILLKSGNYTPLTNFEAGLKSLTNKNSIFQNGKLYRYIQFYQIPTQEEKNEFESIGITFLNYIPNNTFIVSIDEHTNFSVMQSKSNLIRSIMVIENKFKLHPHLLDNNNLPSWAIFEENQIDLVVQYFYDQPKEFVINDLIQKGAEIIDELDYSQLLTIRIDIAAIQQFSSLPYLNYLEPIAPPSEPENLVGRTDHRSNVIANDAIMMRNYDGSGVNVAMGDDGFIGPHIDYHGRINQSKASGNIGNHGDHVAGTIMGAGNLDPKARGMAYGATLHVYNVWEAYQKADSSYVKDSVRITSTSYSDGCNAGYTTKAQTADKQSRQLNSLLHVFSAGNSGTLNCSYGAGAGWGNVTGGVKIAKNVIAVANLDYKDALNSSSSRGPAHDGRLKPEISAVGTNVFSTIDPHTYDVFTGTSMSCPGVSGTLAQLYQAYKKLNGGNEPSGGLMKNILLNGTDDIGNPGPDYKHGFGRMNALNSIKIIEKNNYLINTISQGQINTHSVNIPSGTKLLKVMLYWTDYEAAVNSNKALVNDLNLELEDPSTSNFKPWVLDPTPLVASLNANATRGIDTLNNVEQITIDNPASGNYDIIVKGFSVPQGPQTYSITYLFINDSMEVTYPIGGESFAPFVTQTIRWDAYDNTGTFSIDYSTDDGIVWNNISSSVNGSLRYYDWLVPSELTGKALIKVKRNTMEAISRKNFSIIGVPKNLNFDFVCEDSLKISWDNVTGATGYEIMVLGDKYMDSVATTNNTYVTLYGFSITQEDWFTVKAIGPDNSISERAVAKKKNMGIANCPLPFDLSAISINKPQTNLFFDCFDNSQIPIELTLKNVGFTTVNNIPISYNINGGTAVNEIYSNSLTFGQSANYTFIQTANFNTAGAYTIAVWTDYTGDGYKLNDTVSIQVIVYNSSLISLPTNEDIESYDNCSTVNSCENINCSLGTNWFNANNNINDEIDWRTNNGTTPSNGTGPTTDYTIGDNNGKYIYLESSNCNNKEAYLFSSCIDLINLSTANLNFAYHMYGVNMGSLHIDVFSDNQWFNDITTPITGNQGDSWETTSIDLSLFLGKTIVIRFRGITGSTGFTSDMALDGISVSETVSVRKHPPLSLPIQISPNPATNELTLFSNYNLNNISITILNSIGQNIYTYQANKINAGQIQNINLWDWKSGIYFIKIENNENVWIEKFVKL